MKKFANIKYDQSRVRTPTHPREVETLLGDVGDGWTVSLRAASRWPSFQPCLFCGKPGAGARRQCLNSLDTVHRMRHFPLQPRCFKRSLRSVHCSRAWPAASTRPRAGAARVGQRRPRRCPQRMKTTDGLLHASDPSLSPLSFPL